MQDGVAEVPEFDMVTGCRTRELTMCISAIRQWDVFARAAQTHIGRHACMDAFTCDIMHYNNKMLGKVFKPMVESEATDPTIYLRNAHHMSNNGLRYVGTISCTFKLIGH